MVSQVTMARRIVLALIVFALTMPLIVIATFHIGRMQEGLPHQIGRFLLTLLLCVFLFRGAPWARWLGAILFAVVGVGEVVDGFVLLPKNSNGIVLILTGSVCLVSAYTLLFVPIVRSYFLSDTASQLKFDLNQAK